MAKKSFAKQASDLAAPEQQPAKPPAQPKEAHFRTNVSLKASTILLMRRMQDQGLIEGKKLTYSGLIDDAIAMLAESKGA